MIPKLNSTLFDWVMWRNGSPIDIFGVSLRSYTITNIKFNMIKHAIGYCNAESLICRPKCDCKAVMFFKDGVYYWFHMSNKEFDYVFK